MNWTVTPFDIKFLDQLNLLPPPEWQSDAYDLFKYNNCKSWFHPYMVLVGKQLGATKQILTATELGFPIYEKLCFKTTSHYQFFKAPEILNTLLDKSRFRKAKYSDLENIAAIDQKATGENRRLLLENHLKETVVYGDKKIEGFCISSLGSGLVIANNIEAGVQLTNYRLKKNPGNIAVPEQNVLFIKDLQALGFIKTHKIPRMVLGEESNWNPEMIYNRASGYCG